MSVPAEGTALVHRVLNDERQDQHGVNVPNVQLLDAYWYVLPLSCCPAGTPCVQVRLHFGLNHLPIATHSLPRWDTLQDALDDTSTPWHDHKFTWHLQALPMSVSLSASGKASVRQLT